MKIFKDVVAFVRPISLKKRIAALEPIRAANTAKGLPPEIVQACDKTIETFQARVSIFNTLFLAGSVLFMTTTLSLIFFDKSISYDLDMKRFSLWVTSIIAAQSFVGWFGGTFRRPPFFGRVSTTYEGASNKVEAAQFYHSLSLEVLAQDIREYKHTLFVQILSLILVVISIFFLIVISFL